MRFDTPYVQSALKAGSITNEKIQSEMEASKSIVKAFCIYQLTNKRISSGIGCGYYDESGADNRGGIHRAMNDYLFEVCFAATETNDGFLHFMDYLMIGFEREFDARDGKTRRPSPEPNVLDSGMLGAYWRKNRDAIIARRFDESERVAVTPNYAFGFKDGIPEIIAMLDRLGERPADEEQGGAGK